MRLTLGGMLTIGVVLAMLGAGTIAYFNDTETSEGNTFTAGTLDLKVDGGDDPVVPWSIGSMKPGNSYFTGFKTLRNAGNIHGKLTVTITNLVCRENGVTEPEYAAGDSPGLLIDPDGWTQQTGYGELWNQVDFRFVKDDGDGALKLTRDIQLGMYGWGYASYWYPDEPGYVVKGGVTYNFAVPVNTPIVLDADFEPDEEFDIGIFMRFFNDTQTNIWDVKFVLDGAKNNVAMNDIIEMDLVFGLTQT